MEGLSTLIAIVYPTDEYARVVGTAMAHFPANQLVRITIRPEPLVELTYAQRLKLLRSEYRSPCCFTGFTTSTMYPDSHNCGHCGRGFDQPVPMSTNA